MALHRRYRVIRRLQRWRDRGRILPLGTTAGAVVHRKVHAPDRHRRRLIGRTTERPTPCHPERSEGSAYRLALKQIPRCARDDRTQGTTTGLPSESKTSTVPNLARMSRIFVASPTATIWRRDGSQYFFAAVWACSAVIAETRAGYVSQ